MYHLVICVWTAVLKVNDKTNICMERNYGERDRSIDGSMNREMKFRLGRTTNRFMVQVQTRGKAGRRKTIAVCRNQRLPL